MELKELRIILQNYPHDSSEFHVFKELLNQLDDRPDDFILSADCLYQLLSSITLGKVIF